MHDAFRRATPEPIPEQTRWGTPASASFEHAENALAAGYGTSAGEKTYPNPSSELGISQCENPRLLQTGC